MINRLGATHWGVWTIKHLVSPFQRWTYRATGGRVLSTVGKDRQVLLLTTTGRRTQTEHTIPVFYLRFGEALAICNVKPQLERTNPWVLNLRSNPVARIQIGRHTAQVHAREATEEEIDVLWPRMVRLWPAFKAHYERGGHRSIFILERI